jgi:hypothetical protein
VKKKHGIPIVSFALQLVALLTLIFLPHLNAAVAMVLWFIFGFGAAAHMLAFSAAADVVRLKHIGTSAAIVNGTMFFVSGLLIARPGEIVNRLTAASMPVSAELAQRAVRPLALGLIGALVLSALIRESYPKANRQFCIRMRFMIALQHLWDPTEGVYNESLKGFCWGNCDLFSSGGGQSCSIWNCETTRFIHSTYR